MIYVRCANAQKQLWNRFSVAGLE